MNRCRFSMPRPLLAPAAAALAAALWLVPAASLHAQEVPFIGKVVEQGTALHAGTGRAYYKVGQLNKGDTVTVVKVVYGWNEIKSPKGVYSYISRGFVDARGNGSTGVVNKDKAPVMAAAIQGPPGNSYHTQCTLDKGDTVHIVATAGDYYKITPPDAAHVFALPGSIRRVKGAPAPPKPKPENKAAGGGEAQHSAGNPPPSPASGEGGSNPPGANGKESSAQNSGETSPGQNTPKPTPKPANPIPDNASNQNNLPPADGNTAESGGGENPSPENNRAAPGQGPGNNPPAPGQNQNGRGHNNNDHANAGGNDHPGSASNPPAANAAAMSPTEVIHRVFSGSPLPQDPDQLGQMANTLQKALDAGQLSAINQRRAKRALTLLRFNRRRIEALKDAAAAIDEANTPAKQPPSPTHAREQLPPSVRYDATGVLKASSVFDGQNLPRLYRIVNNGRTVVYVKPGAKIKPNKMLGRAVGVIGSKHRDPATKQRIIDVRKIDLLHAEEQSSPPASDHAKHAGSSDQNSARDSDKDQP